MTEEQKKKYNLGLNSTYLGWVLFLYQKEEQKLWIEIIIVKIVKEVCGEIKVVILI